jgi:hypothetical protein
MKSFEATSIVEPTGEIRVVGVPFSAGTEVDVIVSPKRQSAKQFRRQWDEVCRLLRSSPTAANLTDEGIAAEIAEHRQQR